MTLAALRWTLLASTLAACSQSEPPPVPAFETVTIEFAEPSAQRVPLPARKSGSVAAAAAHASALVATATAAQQGIVSPVPIGPDGRPVATSQDVASSKYASVTRYIKRWLPDFNQITDCPNGITCQAAFAN